MFHTKRFIMRISYQIYDMVVFCYPEGEKLQYEFFGVSRLRSGTYRQNIIVSLYDM